MSAPSSLSILERFKRGYIQFIDELLEQFPNEPDLIIIRVFFQNEVPVTSVAESFISNVLLYKEMIKKRDETFFLENNHMFGMLDGGKVSHFKKLWTSDRLDEDDKYTIWQWFDLFCALTEAYKNSSR